MHQLRSRDLALRTALALVLSSLLAMVLPGRIQFSSASSNAYHVTLAAGQDHFCAIKPEGSLWCWGKNDRGQLGIGTTLDQGAPAQVGTDTDWITVAGGYSSTCGIRSTLGTAGTLWCWGENDFGELGIGALPQQVVPAQVGTAETWTKVSVGIDHTCAITSASELYCWGSNWSGQLGSGAGDSALPVQIASATNWVDVSSNGYTTVGVDEAGQLWTWGADNSGQLGGGTTSYASVPTPQQIGSETTWAIAVQGHSYNTTCAQRLDGSLWCAGDNNYGIFGDGTQGNASNIHVRAGGGTSTYSSASISYSDYMCAIRSGATQAGSLWCWGSQYSETIPGAKIEGGTENPSRLGSDNDWAAVATSGSAACAMRTSGIIYCWGDNNFGQLARGLNPITMSGTWSAISAGSDYTCGIRGGDHVGFCWGTESNLLLGHAQADPQLRGEPAAINTDSVSSWQSLAPGSTFTCGIAQSGVDAPAGSAWCWGYTRGGVLGNGSGAESYARTPVRVGDPSCTGTPGCAYDLTWDTLSLSSFSACGLEHGRLWCWGEGLGGDLGDGESGMRDYGAGYLENYRRTIPAQIGDSSDWIYLTSGMYRNNGGGGRAGATRCGIQAVGSTGGGSLWCWGRMFGDSPSTIGFATDWRSVAVGEEHVCAIKLDSTLWCWGYNQFGQLGLGDADMPYGEEAPTMVGEASDWTAISAGSGTTCGLRDEVGLFCWGNNFSRLQAVFGDPSTSNVIVPTQIDTPYDPSGIAALSMHGAHACVVSYAGTAACHGSAGSGELGIFERPESSGSTWRLWNAEPTPDPTPGLSASATPDPSASATPDPTPDPSASATPDPTPDPSASATPDPTPDPSASAAPDPSATPNTTTQPSPSRGPEPSPSADASAGPSASPTPNPSNGPGQPSSPPQTPSPDDPLAGLPASPTEKFGVFTKDTGDNTRYYVNRRTSSSYFASTVPSLRQAFTNPGVWVGALLIAAGMALAAIALDAPTEWLMRQIKLLFGRVTAYVKPRDRGSRLWKFLGIRIDVIPFLLLGQLIASLNAPLNGLPSAAQLALGCLYGAIAALIIHGVTKLPEIRLQQRAHRDSGEMRAQWLSIGLAIIAVAIGHILGLVPGLVVGIYSARYFRKELNARGTATGAWQLSLLLIALSLMSWVALDMVGEIVVDARSPIRSIADAILGTLVVAGSQGLVWTLLNPAEEASRVLRSTSFIKWFIALFGGVAMVLAILASGGLDDGLFSPKSTPDQLRGYLITGVVLLMLLLATNHLGARQGKSNARG